jgi:Histidine kinase-, DNA gyrase B-, and HSP90-like ATPase
MIQNSNDAIMARRKMTSNREYEGRIQISVRRDGDRKSVLEVQDDGVGMSRDVLTGPLLDFGSSFWSSPLVAREFPGLLSSGFRAVGRFGIGFYSIFMVAKSVSVSSRRWDKGLDETLTLDFPIGLTLRPMLSKLRPDGFEESTLVSIQLIEPLEAGCNRKINPTVVGVPEYFVGFDEYVSAICCGLDVRVDAKIDDGDWQTVHHPISRVVSAEEKKKWLKEISFAKHNSFLLEYIETDAHRMKPVVSAGKTHGLVAVSTYLGHYSTLCRQSVGGLANACLSG